MAAVSVSHTASEAVGINGKNPGRTLRKRVDVAHRFDQMRLLLRVLSDMCSRSGLVACGNLVPPALGVR